MKKAMITVVLCLVLVLSFSACMPVPAATSQQTPEAEVTEAPSEEPSAEPGVEGPAPEPEEGYAALELHGLTVYYPEALPIEDLSIATNIYCTNADDVVIGFVTVGSRALGSLAQEEILEQEEYAEGLISSLEASQEDFSLKDSQITTLAGKTAHLLTYDFTSEGIPVTAECYSLMGSGVIYTLNFVSIIGSEADTAPTFDDIKERLYVAG